MPGVPLGSLPPCLDEARELGLKQRLVASSPKVASCGSTAGRFHFVETKNVNAFLLGIERAPGRRGGDRCQELALAIECLETMPRGGKR